MQGITNVDMATTEMFRLKKRKHLNKKLSEKHTRIYLGHNGRQSQPSTRGVEGCHHVILNDRSSLDGRVRPTLKALHLVQAHHGETVQENSINLRATGHCRSDDWKL